MINTCGSCQQKFEQTESNHRTTGNFCESCNRRIISKMKWRKLNERLGRAPKAKRARIEEQKNRLYDYLLEFHKIDMNKPLGQEQL